eukprot:scaffold14288_cov109-Isochrysis_galbana.AAC.5
MPTAGAVWPLMGAEVSCISSIQAAERRAGRGSVGRAKGAANSRCVTGVCRTWGGKRAWHKRQPRAVAGTTSELGQTAAVSGIYRVGAVLVQCAVGGGELRLGEVPTA